MAMSTMKGCQVMLEEYDRVVEWEDGNDPGDNLGKIQAAKLAVEEIEQDFKAHQQRRVNLGYEPPKEMDASTQQKYDEALARLDVLLEERDRVAEKLKAFVEEEREKRLLQHGPRGDGKGDPLREIDGQFISIKDERLVIDDKRSPYHGMSVPDYRKHVQEPWCKARKKAGKSFLTTVKKEQLPPWPEGVKKVLK